MTGCSYCDSERVVATGFKARRAGASPVWVVDLCRSCLHDFESYAEEHHGIYIERHVL